MNFQVLHHGKVVGEVGKEWFTWGDSFRVRVIDEGMETIMIALVVAIDCVKADESSASSGGQFKKQEIMAYSFIFTKKIEARK
jgi:hypothetical protein